MLWESSKDRREKIGARQERPASGRSEISTEELNRMAQTKRMVTPSKDIFPGDIYASFGELPAENVINQSELGLEETPDSQVRLAAWLIANGKLTVDEAISNFGELSDK